MNDVDYPSNDRESHERQPKAHERPFAGERMTATLDDLGRERSTSAPRWLTPGIIVAFWLLHYLIYTTYELLNDSAQMIRQALVPRAINSAFAIAISAGMVIILKSLRYRRLSFRALTAVLLTVITTAVHLAWVNFTYSFFFAAEPSNSPLWVGYATDYLTRFWWFAALAAIILALSYVDDIREREERIGALQALAHDPQL